MQSTFIISLDFELFWGMQDCSSLEKYQDHVLGGRRAIPQMLELFKRHGIHATWATVGFQFAEDYEELQRYFPTEDQRPGYKKSIFSSYRCFDSIGKNEEEAPCFYSSLLIREISCCEGQEIGSHTFSHYYCAEAGQTPGQFSADMKAALALAADHGYHITSIVFPRNQCIPEYVKVVRELGFTAYRGIESGWVQKVPVINPLKRLLRLADIYLPLTGQGGYMPKNEDGIVNLMGSRMYKPYLKPLAFMENIKIFRIKRQMLHAARRGLTFHLWWHPHNVGVRTEFHMKQLEEIFSYYDMLKEKYGMHSLNMREAAEEILSRC